MASIYEIADFVASSSSYVKNDIVYCGPCGSAEENSGRYFYYTGPANTNAPKPGNTAQTVWGGYTTYNNVTVPHFFWIPSYTAGIQSTPKVDIVKFGDGYEQRTTHGISNDLIKLSLNFDKIDEKETTAIAHFLHARGAKEAFAFLPPPPYGSMKKFVCRTWDVTMNFHNDYSIKCDFEEVIE